MGPMSCRVVIVGAGHAGGALAAVLRQYGHEGPITLIGEEGTAPYQRPPLSKAALTGDLDPETLVLRPNGWYIDNGINLLLNEAVRAIDRPASQVVLASGQRLSYDALVLATGVRARNLDLPGSTLAGIATLRTIEDARTLKGELASGRRLVVVGGGYVGLEVAASAIAAGCSVTVLEREARVLNRVAGPTLSEYFERRHRSEGVILHLGVQVASFFGNGSRVEGVKLTDGREVAADVVLVGIGGLPNQELAIEAGLQTGNGVIVDEATKTSDPRIFAIGDVAYRPLPLYDEAGRLESVPNALEQAKQAARSILHQEPPEREVPWFWSDQYNVKLQIAGLISGADNHVIRGNVGTDRFSVFYLLGDRLLAVEAINSPADFMGGKRMIASREPLCAARLADPAIPIKDVAMKARLLKTS